MEDVHEFVVTQKKVDDGFVGGMRQSQPPDGRHLIVTRPQTLFARSRRNEGNQIMTPAAESA